MNKLNRLYKFEDMSNEDVLLNNGFQNVNQLIDYSNSLKEEIERLNNIINKLEAHCDIELNRLAVGTSHTYEDSLGKTRFVNEDIYNEIGKIKYILQELKGSDKE